MRRLFPFMLLAFSSLPLGSGCHGSARADFDLSGSEGTLVFESEKNFAQTTVDDRYRIFNNGWNANASGGPHRQKIFVKQSNGKPIFGWVWKWWGGGTDVASYPEIQVGHSPWVGEVAPNSGFPFRVGSKKLVVDFDVSMQASGSYDLAFEFWAVSSPAVTKVGITHEVMIWLAENRLGPAGNLVGTATIGGNRFRIYFSNNHGDASGVSSNTWTIISLVADKPILHGPLDIGAIIDYLLHSRLLDGNVYVACLELGNEVASGSGKTEVRNYAVRVE
jgi:Glycosyl hydrolase family 12